MQKTIDLRLRNFAPTPSSLRINPEQEAPRAVIPVQLGRLYHHYYWDGYGVRPPNPAPSNFEYVEHLSATDDFRFRGDGAGSHTAKRQAISNQMGQAFCRWFLAEHLGIRYFAHMNHVLDREHAAFEGLSVVRISSGDVPDYLCARSVDRFYVAEAKGRLRSVGFDTEEYAKWRLQFDRVQIRDRDQSPCSVKGFIVATRFTSDGNRPTTRSTIFAEDPRTPGDSRLGEGNNDGQPGLGVVAVHYAAPASRIGQPLLSAALAQGFLVPREAAFQLGLWRCLAPPLQDREFSGGLVLPSDLRGLGVFPWLMPDHSGDWLLPLQSAVFVGLETTTLEVLAKASRLGWDALRNIEPMVERGESQPQLTWLQDGTVMGPAGLFEFMGTSQL